MHEGRPSTRVTAARSGTRSPVKVVIADDHLLFAESLRIALTVERYAVRQIPLTESGGSIASAAAAMIRYHPDIALLDLDLGRIGDGMTLVEPLTQAGVAVVVLTAGTDRGRWGECVERGAVKVLTKTSPLNDLLATIRRVAFGVPVMEPAERAELLAAWHERRKELHQYSTRLAKLTARERDVLGHLTLGRTVSDIASLETLSQATVRTQVKSILGKLEVSSQIAAVGIAHRVGWRSPVY